MKQSDLPKFERPCPFPVCKLQFDAQGNCTHCGEPVHDLSAGTEQEAHSFLRDGARSCVAYAVDAAGRVVFGRGALTAGLVVAAAAATALAVQLQPEPKRGCAPPEKPPSDDVTDRRDPTDAVTPPAVEPELPKLEVLAGLMMPPELDVAHRKGG